MGRTTAAATPIAAVPRPDQQADGLQLARSVMPMSGASMRLLEATIAIVAIATAALLGLAR